MKILAHRGYWNTTIKDNSYEALIKALDNGFGFESDIREYCGKLVISHDIANEESYLAENIFEKLSEYDDKYCFAINIKSDGLKSLLLDLLKKYNIENYFTFDMSVPQMIEYYEKGLKYFTRQSEYEKELVLYEKADGVWVDAFIEESWITEELLNTHLKNGKKVCIVSPDLHKREYLDFWNKLKSYNIDFNDIILCTDFPLEARKFFGNI
ncbi:hypothetical protein [uncultured Clostridium sp.]|uniref:hypothetical protein n=1 Tax=uncultured Clostridium sp. TaxID=59620 RepID=UPI0027DB7D0C|nr:hypothetical protein [uncultured Clostridium sp.]